ACSVQFLHDILLYDDQEPVAYVVIRFASLILPVVSLGATVGPLLTAFSGKLAELCHGLRYEYMSPVVSKLYSETQAIDQNLPDLDDAGSVRFVFYGPLQRERCGVYAWPVIYGHPAVFGHEAHPDAVHLYFVHKKLFF